MKRREFVALLGGAVASWPLVARAQQAALPVVGYLSGGSAGTFGRLTAAFKQGLSDAGYDEGRNVIVEYRWADDHYDRLPAMANDLVGRQVAVLVASGGDQSPLAAKQATNRIPIVFTAGGDPVATGLVASLNRPGGNATGVHLFVGVVLIAKQIELLSELVPNATIIGLLVNPHNTTVEAALKVAEDAGRTLGRQIKVFDVGTANEIDAAFANVRREQVQALVLHADPLFTEHLDRLVALVKRDRLPAIFYQRESAAEGVLASYGESLTEQYRQVGTYAGRILKGKKPADLPVLQPTKFDFVLNLKTAKSLGLTVPLPLQARADEVIE
jgi:putative ABC transport system substrate-binding protein